MTDPFDVDAREAKLPRWAQEKLADMRRLTRDAQQRADTVRLDTKPDESDTLLDMYDAIPIGLGKGRTVWFVTGQDRFGRDKHVYVKADDWGRVVVAGSDMIDLQPQSGNVVHVVVRGR